MDHDDSDVMFINDCNVALSPNPSRIIGTFIRSLTLPKINTYGDELDDGVAAAKDGGHRHYRPEQPAV